MILSDLERTISTVVEAIESSGAAYYIVGSVASSLYGMPRSTMDIDIVSDLQESQLAMFFTSLGERCYFDKDYVTEAVRHETSFNVIVLATSYKIDVFVKRRSGYAEVAFSRALPKKIGLHDVSVSYNFASVEDVIIGKLQWYRLGQESNPQQRKDIESMLLLQAKHLDLAYLNKWTSALGVDDIWKKIQKHN